MKDRVLCFLKWKTVTNIFVVFVMCLGVYQIISNVNLQENKEQQEKVESVAIEAAPSCSISACLYDNSSYTGTGSILSTKGVTVSGWEYNKSKFLKVNVSVDPDLNKTHIVEINMPKEFYVVSTDVCYPVPGFKSVNFVKNADFSGLNGGEDTYYIHDTSGKLTYVLQDGIQNATIQIELRYDDIFWDKQTGSSITPSGVIPLEVSLKHQGSSANVSKLMVNKVTAGEETYRYMSTYWDTTWYDYNEEYMKGLYIVIDPYDNGAEGVYLKDAKVEVDIPYYVDQRGKKHYLDLIHEGETEFYVIENTEAKYRYSMNNHLRYEITESKAIFYVDNFFVEHFTDDVLWFALKFPPELLGTNDDEEYTFVGGHIKMTGISNNGTSNIVLGDNDISENTYYTSYEEGGHESIIEIYDWGQNDVYRDTSKAGVDYMGGYTLENYGDIEEKM
ncbi:MAG: hypothetical protein E7262_04505 [Lachnospiraceae bacterium]|nr:hypothetical protein [Lachnospiraceae bacterium]